MSLLTDQLSSKAQLDSTYSDDITSKDSLTSPPAIFSDYSTNYFMPSRKRSNSTVALYEFPMHDNDSEEPKEPTNNSNSPESSVPSSPMHNEGYPITAPPTLPVPTRHSTKLVYLNPAPGGTSPACPMCIDSKRSHYPHSYLEDPKSLSRPTSPILASSPGTSPTRSLRGSPNPRSKIINLNPAPGEGHPACPMCLDSPRSHYPRSFWDDRSSPSPTLSRPASPMLGSSPLSMPPDILRLKLNRSYSREPA